MSKKTIQITVPTNQSEITLKQYQEFVKYAKESEEEKASEFEIKTKMIEIMCGVPREAVLLLRKVDFDSIVSDLTKVLKAEQQRFDIVRINGKDYGLIPKMEDITTGEFVDIDSYISEWETVHLAINVLYRPIKSRHKGKYLIEDYQAEYDENIDDIPLSAVNGVMVFFYNLSNDLLRITPNYLAKQYSKIPRQQRERLKQNGAGIRRFIVSLNLTTSALRQQLTEGYLPTSHSWPLKKTKQKQTKQS